MNLNSIMRLSYVLGWVFAAVAVVYRGIEMAGAFANRTMPVSSRGVLFFAGFLFIASIASSSLAQAEGGKSKGASA